MKKILTPILLLVVVTLALSTTSVAYAQEGQPTGSSRGLAMMNGDGPLHDYMIQAYADTLGLSFDQIKARLESGETVFQIALSLGFPAEQIPTLLRNARAEALQAAIADGVIVQAQADRMMQRGNDRGVNSSAYGQGPCGGTSQPIGQGMKRGRR